MLEICHVDKEDRRTQGQVCLVCSGSYMPARVVEDAGNAPERDAVARCSERCVATRC